MVQPTLLITGLFATVSFALATPPSVSTSLDLPKWSTKYPGKLYNSLAESATNVVYSSPANSTKIRARSDYYIVCDGPSVVQNAQCTSGLICDNDGFMDISAVQGKPNMLEFYCQTHCVCDGSDDEASDDEPEVSSTTPVVCGTTYCESNHQWCMVDGTSSGCGDVTVTRAAGSVSNAVSGRLAVHQDAGAVAQLKFTMALHQETAVVSTASLGTALIFLLVLF